MQAPSQSAAQEAKQLNITLEQEDGEWIAVLPPHPDLKDDEALGFPAPSEQEALDEARAYRSIEQSSVYKFEYDEKRDLYVVTFNDQKHEGKLLAKAYQAAQKAYAEFINKPEPPAAEPPTPAPPKQRRPRRAATGNGSQPEPTPMPPPNPNITSGIGTGPTQLAPSVSHEDIRKEARAAIPPGTTVTAQNPLLSNEQPSNNPWETLSERIDRLENILRDALTATAKALEELKNR